MLKSVLAAYRMFLNKHVVSSREISPGACIKLRNMSLTATNSGWQSLPLAVICHALSTSAFLRGAGVVVRVVGDGAVVCVVGPGVVDGGAVVCVVGPGIVGGGTVVCIVGPGVVGGGAVVCVVCAGSSLCSRTACGDGGYLTWKT